MQPQIQTGQYPRKFLELIYFLLLDKLLVQANSGQVAFLKVNSSSIEDQTGWMITDYRENLSYYENNDIIY